MSAVTYPVRLFRRFAWPESGPDFESPADFGLSVEPFEVLTEDRLRIRGWTVVPPDPWGMVVVCHARSANKSRTLGHLRLLVEQGLGAVAFDFRGCGDSDPPRVRGRGRLAPLRAPGADAGRR